jgi:outer membrane protein OmpA-like peptidoglycan-associated protein
MPKSSSYRSSKPGYANAPSREQEPFFMPQGPIQEKKEDSFFQTKLSIGQAGDKYEKEADSVADKVVSKKSMDEEPAIQRQEISSIQRQEIGPIQRLATPQEDENFATNDERMKRDRELREKPEVQLKCAHCEEEEKKGVQKKDEREETSTVQRSEASAPATASASLTNRIDSSRGSGSPIPGNTLNEMQSSFGTNFSNVNIHTDAESVNMNRELGAQAFTHGNDIYFNSGKFNPDSTTGKHLLAHELTHVVQQGGGGSAVQRAEAAAGTIQRKCGPSAAAAGASGCTPLSSSPTGERIHFRINCDDLTAGEKAKIAAFADSMNDTDRVNVHGFASIDGPADFNEKLSCARAKKVANILKDKGIPESRINIFEHGPTAGSATEERSVIMEMASGVSRLTTPQLTAEWQPPTLSHGCNDTQFDIDWQLSRNSGPKGGFIIQDLTITWLAKDCNGHDIPFTVTSPLHYFEAWRVLPNSKAIDPTDGNIDIFKIVIAPPAGSTAACTTGKAQFTGIAHYHDNVDTLPSGMVRNNSATWAGSLKSSVTDPAVGGNISRTVPHNFAFHWNCCPCTPNPGAASAVVDSQTPS